jgi:hypothetical protein
MLRILLQQALIDYLRCLLTSHCSVARMLPHINDEVGLFNLDLHT